MNNICKIVVLFSFMICVSMQNAFAQTLSTGNRTTTRNKSVLSGDVNLEQYEKTEEMKMPEAPEVETPEIKQEVSNEKTEEDLERSGVYTSPSKSSVMLYPDTLAVYCGVDASTVADSEEGTELHNCVNKVVRDINNTDSSVREKSLKEVERLRYDELKSLFSSSVEMKVKISNFTEEQENLGNANINTMTEMDDQVIVNEAISKFISSMTDINNEYANSLRGRVFSSFNKVNPSVLEDMVDTEKEEEKEEEANPNPYNVEYFDRTVVYTQENPYLSPFVWIKNNMCRRNVCLTPTGVEVKTAEDLSCTPQDAECPDGDYATSDPNVIIFCYSSRCSAIDKSRREQLEGGISEIKYIEGDKCEVTRVNQGNSNTKVEICPDGEYEKDGICIRCTEGKCINVTCGSEDGEEGGGEFHIDYLGNNRCSYDDTEIKCPNGGPYMTKDGSACYSCQDRGCDEVDCETGDIIMREGLYLGSCKCVVEGVSSACSDGIYVNNKGSNETCVAGELSEVSKKIGFDNGKAVITVGEKSYYLTTDQYLNYIKSGKLPDGINWQAAEAETQSEDSDNLVDKAENLAGKVLTWGSNAANSLLGRNKKNAGKSK